MSPAGVSALCFFPMAPPPPRRGRARFGVSRLLLAERAPHRRSDALPGGRIVHPRILLEPREARRLGLHGIAPAQVLLAAELVPGERRRDAGGGPCARRESRDGARGLGVAQVIDEHPVLAALLRHFRRKEA